MSRRLAEETTERHRPGKPHEVSQTGLVPTHVKSSVSFLNPDISIGGTNLERAPSLNRLHAQSSTETSGLGETVTSGFSSQESVLSYLGDDKDRGGGGLSYVERSRRRPGGSPGSGRAIAEPEAAVHRDDGYRTYSGLAKQHISKQQRQQQIRLTIPQPSQRLPEGEIKSFHDSDKREEYDSQFLDQHQSGSRRQKTSRDTGGRSLTPQQAKEELEGRQRKVRQAQQEREAALYLSPRGSQADVRPGTVSNSSERPRKLSNPGQKQRERDSFELSTIKEQHPGDGKVRLYSSGSSSSKADSKSSDHRPVLKSDRSDLSHPAAEASKPTKKAPSSQATSSRPSATTSRRDSSELRSNLITSSESKGSSDWTEAASTSRGRSASQIVSREREKRAASKSRDQLKSQCSSPKTNSDEYNESSGSKKSYETQILNRQSPRTKSSSSGELTESVFTYPESEYNESQRNADKKRRRDQNSADVKKSAQKISGSHSEEAEISAKLSQTRGSRGEDGSIRKQQQDVHSSRRRNSDRDDIDAQTTSAYYKHRHEPAETTRTVKPAKELEQATSFEKNKGGDQLGRNYPRQVRQNEPGFPEDIHVRDPRRQEAKRNGRADVRESSDKTDVGDPRDIDLGPILIRGATIPRVHETRPKDQRVKETPSQEDILQDRCRDTRRVTADRVSASGRSRDSSTTRTSHTKRTSPDELSGKGKTDRASAPVLRAGTSQEERLAGHPVANIQAAGVERMNYERLFHQASRDMNGTGGGSSSRTHPASFNASQASASSDRAAVGVHGQSHNNVHRNGQVQPSEPASRGNSSSPPRQDQSVQVKSSASYTTAQSSSSAPPTVPTVQLTSPEDPAEVNTESVDREWERRDSRNSIRSGTSSRFLGVNTGSAWTKWSRERRASYRRRLEKMEQENPKTTVDAARISTPIKKARQEGLKFVHPDLEARYLSEDDINELRRHKQQQVQAMRVIERSRRHKFRLKNELKLTPEQWHLLQEYWNHTFFVRARFLGILVSLVTLIFIVVSITHHSWLKHTEGNTTIVEGLWINCTQSAVIAGSPQTCASSSGRNWQNAVIGLLIFAATFAFLGSVLSICGVFTNPLPRKIYYFHSAGEIFFICALSTSVALIVFPIAVELDDTIHSHHYGLGYGLGWLGNLFLFAAAICMSLDDLVRESSRAKVCRWCWRSKPTNRSELRQV